MKKIYYSPKGLWKGLLAVVKLAKEAKVSKNRRLIFKETGGVADIFAPPPKENNTAQVWCVHPIWNSPGSFVVFAAWHSQPQDTQVRPQAASRWYWKQIQRGGAADFKRQQRSCEGVWEYLQAKVELSEDTTGGPWQGIYELCDTADGETQRKYQTRQVRDPQRPGFV